MVMSEIMHSYTVCDNCRRCCHTTHAVVVQAPCGWAGGGVISSCVLLAVTFLIIVLASKQLFADFLFTSSFQQAHLLPPVSLQHWFGSLDLFASGQSSLRVNEGRFVFCRTANLALIVCFVSQAESRWIVELLRKNVHSDG